MNHIGTKQTKEEQIKLLYKKINGTMGHYLRCHDSGCLPVIKGNLYLHKHGSLGESIIIGESGKELSFKSFIEVQEFFEDVPYDFKNKRFILD